MQVVLKIIDINQMEATYNPDADQFNRLSASSSGSFTDWFNYCPVGNVVFVRYDRFFE